MRALAERPTNRRKSPTRALPALETPPTGSLGGIERVVLSALDGAACTLGVSREELVLALRSTAALHAFARANGLSEDEVDDAVRAGILRAVDDAEREGSIEPRTASLLRTAAERLPIGFVLDLIRGVSRFLPS